MKSGLRCVIDLILGGSLERPERRAPLRYGNGDMAMAIGRPGGHSGIGKLDNRRPPFGLRGFMAALPEDFRLELIPSIFTPLRAAAEVVRFRHKVCTGRRRSLQKFDDIIYT